MCSSSWNNAFGQVYKFVMRVLLRRISVKGFQLHSIFFVDIIFTCAHFDTHGCRKPVSSLYSAFKSVSYVYQQVPIFVQVNGISENMPHLFIVFWMLIFFGFIFISFRFFIFISFDQIFHYVIFQMLHAWNAFIEAKKWLFRLLSITCISKIEFYFHCTDCIITIHQTYTGMLYRIHQKSRNIPDTIQQVSIIIYDLR